MEIIDCTDGPTTIVGMKGRWICGDDLRTRARDHVQHLIEIGRLDVVLDLSGVTFADSTVVGEIASMCLALRRRGGRLTLLNPTTQMARLLCVSRLDTVIEVRRSDDPPAPAWARPSGEISRGVNPETQVPIWNTVS